MPKSCPKCTGLDLTGRAVPALYDGVLFWQCVRCGFAFPRDFGPRRNLQLHSENYAGAMNRGRENRPDE